MLLSRKKNAAAERLREESCLFRNHEVVFCVKAVADWYTSHVERLMVIGLFAQVCGYAGILFLQFLQLRARKR